MTLLMPSKALWQGQAILVLIYTVIISIWLPEFWLHPFGPILKNIPFSNPTLATLQTRGHYTMNTYLLLKWAHILSSVLLVGTGFGSAFYLYFTHRTRNIQAIAEVAKLVVHADFWFTTACRNHPTVDRLCDDFKAGNHDDPELVIVDLCLLRPGWYLLASGGLATIAYGRHGDGCCKEKRRALQASIGNMPTIGNGWAILRSSQCWAFIG